MDFHFLLILLCIDENLKIEDASILVWVPLTVESHGEGLGVVDLGPDSRNRSKGERRSGGGSPCQGA